mgnify:CR=1 FL=1
MINYKLLIYTLIIFSSNCFSQKNKTNGEVTYQVCLDLINNKDFINKSSSSKEVKDLVKKTIKSQDTINYKLSFKGFESLFEKEKRMKVEEGKFDLISILVGKGVFYTNRVTKKRLNQKESFGEVFLIDIPPIKWVLTQETKKIGRYICYKATTIKVVENRRGKKNINITAWYTPDIVANFGPKEYGELPGLILELREGDLLFRAKDIKLNSKEKVEFKKPLKGKKITLEEHSKIIKDIVSKHRRNKF